MFDLSKNYFFISKEFTARKTQAKRGPSVGLIINLNELFFGPILFLDK
jgi:hypothetical protein